ncbi:hypothetical protein G7K_1202-t1 [Saitoella complicata NRRL Y-17804]|uniref:Pre-mRNA-splicing factor SYF1 n=1 Tax=Saitoella complicata (strain BCRC 22490 / CBS 7301 / JCM 7358 / NBRC 10748 / NRRL Y-17804) TaxID=698492 RepID=A0A0E9NB10_SAICN|nr:hypothetical protein G7K_1202-t1 [Saitoella complicata NRRL Y-17804]
MQPLQPIHRRGNRSVVEDMTSSNIDLYLISLLDEPYEQELLRNPYSLKSWQRYINHKSRAPLPERVFVYERACLDLPGSYKLWKEYLELRVRHLSAINPARYADEFEKVNDAFEKSLVLLNKMPRIWEMYLEFLMSQPLITRTRRTFDKALRALPLTQHERIWKMYLPWAKSAGGETAMRVWKRYMQIAPEQVESYIDVLIENEYFGLAAKEYLKVLNNTKFRSLEGKSHFQLWTEMCDILVHHPRSIPAEINVEKIIRSGIQKFTDQRGKLWTSLATYFISLGDFERARDIFEEGITTVITVRDFTQVFDAYAEYEESLIAEKMQDAEEGNTTPEDDLDLDIRMARFEQLMDRRPFLVNDVLLRQNPHNTEEWQKRVSLWANNPEMVVKTYTDALATIHHKKATGKLAQIWVNFAKFYEEGGRMTEARQILEKSTNVTYKTVNELADIWIEWAEMELRQDEADRAFAVMKKATEGPRKSTVDFNDDTLTPQARLHKCMKLWSFYVDLEEGLGTVETTKAVYDRIMELRIATAQIIVNYANFLEENEYFEESFKVYERGVDVFTYPIAFELWNLYLSKFIKRYGGTQLERARDLFEQALENCPPKFAKPIFLLYADLEEQHGLARHVMRIYDRAASAVAEEDRKDIYDLYIAKSVSQFGLTSARPIYERAIAALPDAEARDMAIDFADMERRLGEIDRARVILAHASQFCDPRTQPSFWQKWHDFEVKHGNEDTFKEMLRIKRTVQAQYNTDINYIAATAATGTSPTEREDAMAALEREAQAPVGFVASSTGPVGGTLKRKAEDEGPETTDAPANVDEIMMDDDDI